ncbi:MAG: macro domain-containing protein [Bilifractor sp.]|jgi:O-acetyl-ADP-ribose deacetylase (regulator of RNase III)
MSVIRIQKISITDIETDAIVNAANSGLLAGGGVCGAIFQRAGYAELQAACDRIGHCDAGDAVITPGFGTKAKYIIHAVGPVWRGGNSREPQILYSAYQSSLRLASAHGCRSIAFPLISAGIFGYPKEQAMRKAFQACRDYLEKNPEAEMEIVFAIPDPRMAGEAERILREQAPEFAG